jgi:predicted O-methyltransferase YrrM
MRRSPNDLLTSLLAEGPPLPSDAWTLGDEVLTEALAAVEGGARTLVECGSGRSTVILARLLARLDAGTVHALEHDPDFAERTRTLLAAEGLDRAEVITAPLEPHPLAGEQGGWYAPSATNALPDSIDLLLIDGPPAGAPELERNRHPVLTELAERLAPGATIIVDDAGRPGEAASLRLWSRDHGLRFDVVSDAGFATARWPVYVPSAGTSGKNAQTRE